MIVGIGVDIIQIRRIKRAVKNSGRRFLEKIFTEKEIEYCLQQKDPLQHFAARFAAKESVLKAFGLGWNSVDWKTIEVINSSSGRPLINLYGRMQELKNSRKVNRIFCSLSHHNGYAVAFVVLEV